MEHWWDSVDRGKAEVFRGNTCSTATLPTIKSTWTELTLNSLSWECMRCLDHWL